MIPLSRMSEGCRVARDVGFGRILVANGGARCIEWVACARFVVLFWFRFPDVSLPMDNEARLKAYRKRAPAADFDRRHDDGMATIRRWRMQWDRIAPGPLAKFIEQRKLEREIPMPAPGRELVRVA